MVATRGWGIWVKEGEGEKDNPKAKSAQMNRIQMNN